MLVTMVLLALLPIGSAPPPKPVLPTLTLISRPADFIRQVGAIHGSKSPAAKLAQFVSRPRRGKPKYAIIKAKWGTYAFAWSMEARFLAIWEPNGKMSCEADGGPCPTDEELGPLPRGFYYDWNQCMGTPAGIGEHGRYFAEQPGEDAFSLIRTYPGGDGAPAREDEIWFSAD